MKKLIALALTFVVTAALVACGGTTSSETANEENVQTEQAEPTEPVAQEETEQAVSSVFPIEINHAFGTTIIELEPQRVATVGWANQDTPIALGIVPVGYSMANFGPVDALGMHEWTADGIHALGEENPNVFQDAAGMDYEAISESNPDIILAAYHGMSQEEYELLSKIAPVVAYPDMAWATLWRDQIIINATALGLEELGREYVLEMEQLIEDKKSEYPEVDGVTGAFIWVNSSDLSSFYLYTPVDTRAAYLTDLGVDFPEIEGVPTDSFFVSVSAENIDMLNHFDILVTYGDHNVFEAMQADVLFSTLPAVQNGAVALIDEATNLAGAATPSALSIPAVIDDYMALLQGAAINAK